jgi:hypothetical protein
VSYLHCPRCQHAYNVATQPACPYCVTDPTDDVAEAADRLARALARATPDQVAAAEARLTEGSSILRALRAPVANPSQAILATVAIALLARLAPPARTPRRVIAAFGSRARALLARF